MTQSKIDIKRVKVTSNSRKLLDEWTFEKPQETLSIHSEEADDELGKLIAKAKGLKAWEDYLPNINEFHRMCEEYPSLNKAFEQFRTAWNLVIDDWESSKKND